MESALYILNMNTELKSAWYTVVVVAMAVIGCLIMGAYTNTMAAFAPLGLMGLLGLTPILFRKRDGKVDLDERDLEVVEKASIVGGVCSYLAFVIGGMALWGIHYYRGESQMNVHLIPLLIFGGAIVLYLSRSIFIISQYSGKALGIDE